MEETTTSWKNHSFTLLIFGGIVVLCSIFFVLGMLVGRNQGRQMAEMAFAEKDKNKPVTVTGGDLKLNYYDEAIDEKSDLKLQPPPEPPTAEPANSVAPVASGSSSTSARLNTPSEKPRATDKTSATKSTAKPAMVAPPSKDRYLQLMATKNQKQAKSELKKVQSKNFKALIMEVTLKNERWYRVMVGPYKESEVSLTQSDLKAKGYKDVILVK
jgi:cell division septation protein DedD